MGYYWYGGWDGCVRRSVASVRSVGGWGASLITLKIALLYEEEGDWYNML